MLTRERTVCFKISLFCINTGMHHNLLKNCIATDAIMTITSSNILSEQIYEESGWEVDLNFS